MGRTRLLLLVLSIAFVSDVVGQTDAEVTFEHYTQCQNKQPLKDGCTINEIRQLSPGGTLTIIVSETRATLFTVEVRGYLKPVAPPDQQAAGRTIDDKTLSEPPAEADTLVLTHNPKYGGYIVTIAPKAGIPEDGSEVTVGDVKKKVQMPGPAVIVVSIDAEEPRYSFSGGISLTSLKNPAFVARPAATAGTFAIEQDEERDDEGTVGLATFINFQPIRKARWFWPGIGIGLETEGNTQYYFSLGIRMADGIFLNPGVVLGQVDLLPAGLQIGDIVDDPNRLSELGSHKKFGFFVGVSFRFLGGGKDTFGRPFAGGGGESK